MKLNTPFKLFLLCFFFASFNVVMETNYPQIMAQSQEKTIASNTELKIINQGKQVLVNGKKENLAWIQWQEGKTIRTGVSDMGAEEVLGIELLGSIVPNEQSVRWFNYSSTLDTKFANPYRYLDLTNLIQSTSLQAVVEGQFLNLDMPSTQVTQVYEQKSFDGNKKVVIELDQPSFFKVSQGRKQGYIIIKGKYNQPVLDNLLDFNDPVNNTPLAEDEEGDKIIGNEEENISLFKVTPKGDEETVVTVNLPLGSNMKVTSTHPNLLVVDLKLDVVTPREISWHDDILLSRQYIRPLNNPDIFLVSALTLNTPKNNLILRPILPNSDTVIGASPLKTMGSDLNIIAGINGGFFNRNNRLPLGSIKDNNNWLSGPILNRGVIAWDDQGNFKIDRLQLEEVVTINNSQRLFNNYLNSGYVQKGTARYTSAWGENYTSLSDRETILVIKNNRVFDKIISNKAGDTSVQIEPNSYLLVLRKTPELAETINIQDQIELNSFTFPREFADYPYMMGAGPLLVLNRQVVLDGEAEKFSKAFNQQKASRSAIAINQQGEVLLVAVHNRVGGAGPSLNELANILLEMGAVSALNLDGGSSTQIYLGGEIIDRASATAARVNNGIGVFLKE